MSNDLRHNYFYNLIDAGFFGFAVGFASFSTVIPLFVSQLTTSQTLIGLVPAVHNVGWMAPQLLTARVIARQRQFKPYVLWMTIHERVPFLGLALVAWFYSQLGLPASIGLTFMLLSWQGMGAGFAANAWQSMIAKIFPPQIRGTFIGVQAAIANVTVAVGAVFAGQILERIDYPLNYVICFSIAVVWFFLSWAALSRVREQDVPPSAEIEAHPPLWIHVRSIWRSDHNFRQFLLARNFTQFASMGFAFYIIYAVRHFGVGEGAAGVLTAALAGSQIVGNVTLGWLGDRVGHRNILIGGALAAITSTGIILFAPTFEWLYAAVILAGIANVSVWTIAMTMTMEFGTEAERPTYIGMSNTLVAPSTILAPVIGGWLADISGYSLTFGIAMFCGLATVGMLLLLQDPQKIKSSQPVER